MSRRRILLSLRPEWAAAIYAIEKRYEFRRRRINLDLGDVVIIYETRPVSLVTGEFTVRSIEWGSARRLVTLERDRARRSSLRAYLRGAAVGTAIGIGKARRYRQPLTLADLDVQRAPMSYLRLPAHERPRVPRPRRRSRR